MTDNNYLNTKNNIDNKNHDNFNDKKIILNKVTSIDHDLDHNGGSCSSSNTSTNNYYYNINKNNNNNKKLSERVLGCVHYKRRAMFVVCI